MKHRKYLLNIILATCVLFTNSCSGQSTADSLTSKTVLVGSTPGDSLIKSFLAINPDKQVDFIRWDLSLNRAKNDSKTYVLNIVFGKGQPNTSGFKGGGEKLSFEGVYTISKSQNREIYELKNEKTQSAISLVKLNDNLFHLLTPDKKLMVGNGGWSYTLSRKDSSPASSAGLPSSFLPDEASQQIIFDGRTPCLNFADFKVGNDCRKLKWRLTLSRDSKTNQPTVYALKSTLNRQNKIEGKWTIIKGVKNNSEALIYQLDPDKPDESISFLVGDENVLFFLDKEHRLLTGNSDFSFTLNRRMQ
jgi:hypothetical protein